MPLSTAQLFDGSNVFGSNVFVIKAGGVPIGVAQSVSGLTLEVETYEYAAGGVNDFVYRLPTRMRYPNLVVRGAMTDKDALMKWFLATYTKAERKELVLELQLMGDRTKVRRWTFTDAYPVRWTGPDMDVMASDIAGETLEIAHQGLKPA